MWQHNFLCLLLWFYQGSKRKEKAHIFPRFSHIQAKLLRAVCVFKNSLYFQNKPLSSDLRITICLSLHLVAGCAWRVSACVCLLHACPGLLLRLSADRAAEVVLGFIILFIACVCVCAVRLTSPDSHTESPWVPAGEKAHRVPSALPPCHLLPLSTSPHTAQSFLFWIQSTVDVGHE